MNEKLNEMKIGEKRNFSDNPCYPVIVEKVGHNAYRFGSGTAVCTHKEAVQRLRPVGCEIY